MSSLQRFWLPAGLLLTTCYNPNIENGKLQCGPNFKCPDGFICVGSACYDESSPPPTGGRGGMGATGGRGGTGGGGMGGGGMCYGPAPACAVVSGGGCDPVCQAGCKCMEKCGVDGVTGMSACRAASPPFLKLSESCDASEASKDACQPGLICLREVRDVCGSHCYRFCRSDSDCSGGARCAIDVRFQMAAPTYRVCTPPQESCAPWGAARCVSGMRPTPAFGCYILSSAARDATVCDCAGTKPLWMPGSTETCTFEHECQPGLECIKLGAEPGRCRRVCLQGAMTVMTGGCPVGGSCRPLEGSTKYGFCG